METDLRERLTDLAERTPHAVPPPDLWDRGVRRHRRARATSALVVAAVVLAVSFAGWTVRDRAHGVPPADSSGAAQLPQTFYLPSSWMHAFDGPPGRLIAVSGAWRSSLFGRRLSLFGVTASSTRYGFLDIPGAADSGKSAFLPLSPDGLHLAMWLGSESIGTRQADSPVTGIEVYDVETGGLRHFQLPASTGLAPGFLGWTDDRTLVVALRPDDGSGPASSSDHVYVWSSANPVLRPLTDPRLSHLDWTEATAADGRAVVPQPNRSTWWVIDPSKPHGAARAVVHGTHNVQLFLSPNRQLAATIEGDGSPLSPSRIVTAAFHPTRHGSAPSVSLDHVVPAGNFFNVVGWYDDHTLLASQQAPGNVQYESRLVKVDIDTGHLTPLVSPSGEHANIGETQFASELLDSRSVPVGPPSAPWDPWTLIGLSLLAAAAVGLAWWSIRGSHA
jgi:hypothetical protein